MPVAGYVGEAPTAPGAAILVFDDRCAFCRRWVERVKRRDRDSVVQLLPLRDEAATALTGQSMDRLRRAVHFVRPDGAVFAGAAAVREVVALLPGFGAVRPLANLPGVMFLAERVYARVARHWGPGLG